MSDKTVIALGYFDSVHLGHIKVINTAKEIATSLNANTVIFTFDGNLKKSLSNKNEKCIFSSEERKQIFTELGFNDIFFAPTTKEFLSKSKDEFLSYLNEKYDIACYVCGIDYKFGVLGSGDINYLMEYAKKHNQQVKIVNTLLTDGEKVSTTLIKEYISNGQIEKANNLLGRSFFVIGTVVKDRGIGKTIGFPTANIQLANEKEMPKQAVYKGRTIVDEKEYLSIINMGCRPTFGLDKPLLEVNLLDFDGDLYGREIKVCFDGFIREIIKFDSVEELKTQLEKDRKECRKK